MAADNVANVHGRSVFAVNVHFRHVTAPYLFAQLSHSAGKPSIAPLVTVKDKLAPHVRALTFAPGTQARRKRSTSNAALSGLNSEYASVRITSSITSSV
jgi:hypothetical protein